MTAQFTLTQDLDLTTLLGDNAPKDHRLICCITDCSTYSNGRIRSNISGKHGMLERPVVPHSTYVPDPLLADSSSLTGGLFNYYHYAGILANASRAVMNIKDMVKRAVKGETDGEDDSEILWNWWDKKIAGLMGIKRNLQLPNTPETIKNSEVFNRLMEIYNREVKQAKEEDSWVMEFILGRQCLTIDPAGFSVAFSDDLLPSPSVVTNGNWGNELYACFMSSYLGKRSAYFKYWSNPKMVSTYSLINLPAEPPPERPHLKDVTPLGEIYKSLAYEVAEHAKRSARIGVTSGLVENANIVSMVAVVNGNGRALYWRQHTDYEL
jgi:hypothetical protein